MKLDTWRVLITYLGVLSLMILLIRAQTVIEAVKNSVFLIALLLLAKND